MRSNPLRLSVLIVLIGLLSACGADPDAEPKSTDTPAPVAAGLPPVPVYAPKLQKPPNGIIAGDVIAPDGTCLVSSLWSVQIDQSTSETRLLASEGSTCPTSSSQADRVYTLDEATFVSGLHRNYLVLDSGTGPDGRSLRVIDLASDETRYDGPYQHDEVHVSGKLLLFYVPIAPPVDAVCAQDFEADGFSTGFEQVSALNLNTGELSPMRGISCSPRQ